jgi:hypothetical protein
MPVPIATLQLVRESHIGPDSIWDIFAWGVRSETKGMSRAEILDLH